MLRVILYTTILQYATGSLVCGALTSCTACSANPECAFCQDTADSFVDPSTNIGGYIFKQHGLNSQESVASNPQSHHAAAYEAMRRQAAADLSLLQQQPASSRSRLDRRSYPKSGSDNERSSMLLELQQAPAGAHAHTELRHLERSSAGLAALNGGSVSAHTTSRDWAAIYAAGGFCMNRTRASTADTNSGAIGPSVSAGGGSGQSVCADLRMDMCDCDGTADLPQCQVVVQELRRPFLLVAAAFISAAAVLGAALAVDTAYRQGQQGGSAAGCWRSKK